ncbi:hypothetical protein [Paraburkholderia sp. C35]|uniref:hypothetical protein n=1 Tax=Paraburkholderia sp. C35 TaxID=2126993 RepID=UPI0013A56F2C|nr:hypothetical protein [Paraburkholderia sp. C35]
MRRLFKSSGETIDLKGPFSAREIEKILESNSLTFVMLLDDEHMMVLRDEDSDGQRPINELATIICDLPPMPKMQRPVRGDALIVPARDIAPYIDVI